MSGYAWEDEELINKVRDSLNEAARESARNMFEGLMLFRGIDEQGAYIIFRQVLEAPLEELEEKVYLNEIICDDSNDWDGPQTRWKVSITKEN